MHTIHFSIITLLQIGFLMHSAESIKIKCTNIDEYYFVDPGSRCTRYYKCVAKNQSEVKQCSSGTLYDFYKQSCTRSLGSENCFDPNCVGRSNGIFQDMSHACKRSFTCHAGAVTSIDNCPSKHLHNGQKCMPQELVSCDGSKTTAIAYSFNRDQRCLEMPDGLNAINGNCNEYLICRRSEVIDVGNCRINHYFHAEKRQCLPKSQVHSNTPIIGSVIDGFVCKNKRDGSIVDPTSLDCSSYIICKHGQLELQKRCIYGAVFNGVMCVPKPLYQCPQTVRQIGDLEDICHEKQNGLHSSPQLGCEYYVRCMAKHTVEINVCSTGQHFDAELHSCVSGRSRCVDNGKSLKCKAKSNGFYQERNCQSYYYCYNGKEMQYKCLNDKLFNGKSCISKSEYTCPQTDVDPFCHYHSDGYYKDPKDGCRSYQFCSNGQKITYLCEEGYMFDDHAKKCILTDNFALKLCKTDPTCHGKSDGYHADLRSNCRNYVFCKNSEKITQLTCRDNRVFNGQKCVTPLEYGCPSLYGYNKINCMPKSCAHRCEKNGFFVELNSNCRDYFFCIDGKGTKLSCSNAMRFNGELCVPDDTFNCPAVCREDKLVQFCPMGGYVETM